MLRIDWFQTEDASDVFNRLIVKATGRQVRADCAERKPEYQTRFELFEKT